MNRLTFETKTTVQKSMESLAENAAQRILATCSGQCPVDTTRSLTRLYLSETCGKCTPCRVGLDHVHTLLGDILDCSADERTVDDIVATARVIVDSADCAIGVEAARMVVQSVETFREDYESHIARDKCTMAHRSHIPCRDKCPAHVNIPGYIALVHEGRYVDALRVIRNDNPLPAVCGYVCEHPCEFACRRILVDDAVNICALKRFADDNAEEYRPRPNLPSTGKSVGVIGGGPAGLTCAYYLQLMGHDVTVYERLPKLGGMLRYGIPDYRLPQSKLDRDIDFILQTGIHAKTGVSVGEDVPYEELASRHDAMYISIGAHKDKKLGIDGEGGDGVTSAVAMLRDVASGKAPDYAGKRVVVVGGGNVAMDCTRTARRLGAESVECVYRRRIVDMTALAEEIEEAMAEGCQITQLEAPVRIELDDEGRVAALVTQPQVIGPIGRDGRPRPVPSEKPERSIPCDVIIVAIGQAIDTSAFQDVVKTEWGKIVAEANGLVDEGSTTFAGGDAVSGPATVILAIAHGKVAAANIDAALGYSHDVYDEVDIPAGFSSLPPTGRVELRSRTFADAAEDFHIAKLGMTRQEAVQESARCLKCDHYGFGSTYGKEALAW